MTGMPLRDVQLMELEILKDVDEFCEANGIDYFINFGTLLGSVRHRGFIPWDDDIDLTMTRENYERFVAGYRSKRNFRVFAVGTERRWYFPMAKVVSHDTLRDRYRRTTLDFGVGIDIFPMDAFASERQIRRIRRIIEFLEKFVQLGFYRDFGSMYRRYGFKALILWPLGSQFLSHLYARAIDLVAKTGGSRDGELLASITPPAFKVNQYFRRSDLLPTARAGHFEDGVFRIPKNVDLPLRTFYGSYLELPPEASRQPAHFEQVERLNRVTVEIVRDKEFGAVLVLLPHDAFRLAGFDLGDACRVTFADGRAFESVPHYDGYYGKTNEVEVVTYPGEPYVKIVRCNGESLWKECGCREGDRVTIELTGKGEFLDIQKTLSMMHSNEPGDYASAEAFANFRPLGGGRMAAGRFFRGASPVNELYNRPATVNRLLAARGIRAILDLGDMPGRGGDYYSQLEREGRVVRIGMSCCYHSQDTRVLIAAGLRKLLEMEGPYYLTCTEGKARTGFVCLLLQSVAGATVREITEDYMLSWKNYFGVSREAKPAAYAALVKVRLGDALAWLNGVGDRRGDGCGAGAGGETVSDRGRDDGGGV